jgi:membrane fusion protein (multidrug efflux system)
VLVPQRAVLKAPKGHYVYVVDKGNKVERRTVFAGEWYESYWIIEKGLAAGESVVVDGLQSMSPGLVVKPVRSDQSVAATPPTATQ